MLPSARPTGSVFITGNFDIILRFYHRYEFSQAVISPPLGSSNAQIDAGNWLLWTHNLQEFFLLSVCPMAHSRRRRRESSHSLKWNNKIIPHIRIMCDAKCRYRIIDRRQIEQQGRLKLFRNDQHSFRMARKLNVIASYRSRK